MKEKRYTHLIYLDKEGHVTMKEHPVGVAHPQDADFFCEIPYNDDSKWITGKPNFSNVQFLTLSVLDSSQKLDVSIGINRDLETKEQASDNKPISCIKYMPIHLLDFRPIPKHISRTIATVGLYHYRKEEPYKTVDVAEDNILKAKQKGRKALNPNTVEHVKYINCKPNEEYDIHYNKKPKLKM